MTKTSVLHLVVDGDHRKLRVAMPTTSRLLRLVQRFTQQFSPSTSVPEGQLLFAALLVHIARVDGNIVETERERLVAVLTERFKLAPSDARSLFAKADAADRATSDLEDLIAPLKRGLDRGERQRLVGLAWEVAKADGAIHEFEDDLIWRAARLLDLDEDEAASLRSEAMARSGGAARA